MTKTLKQLLDKQYGNNEEANVLHKPVIKNIIKEWLTQKRQELEIANTSKKYYTELFIEELLEELNEG